MARAGLDGANWLATTGPAAALQRRLAKADTAEWRWETDPPPRSGKLCVFVTYAPGGVIPERAVRHAEIWQEAGYHILFVVALDDYAIHPDIPFGHAISRENRGHDFAAWSRALNEITLGGLEMLATVNDSVFASAALSDAIARAEAMEADMVGFTESRECRWHLQSYAVLFKPAAIRRPAFAKFWQPRECSRRQVIWTYEVQMAQAMRDAGLRVTTLFPVDRFLNPTHHYWPELLALGFPFVKRSSLPQQYDRWAGSFEAHGFDAALIERERPSAQHRTAWRRLIDSLTSE